MYLSVDDAVAFTRRRIMRNLLTDSRILGRKDAARSSAYSDGWRGNGRDIVRVRAVQAGCLWKCATQSSVCRRVCISPCCAARRIRSATAETENGTYSLIENTSRAVEHVTRQVLHERSALGSDIIPKTENP